MVVSGVDYNLDYRCNKDDAWYTCAVVLDDGGNHLRIKFRDFVQTHFDEVCSIADFSTHREIEEFVHRFRPVSDPVQDDECSRVIEGMIVCAIYRTKDEALYYDAIVDAVRYKEHTPEECLCSYLLHWQHGPGKGTITETNIEDMCFIMHGDIHPKIAEFTNLVKQQLKEVSVQPQVFGSVGHGSHVGSSAGRERFCPKLSDHDIDMGGVKTADRHHYVVLENLEKDLCPLLMMHFIHEHTLITAQTYVFPSLLAETYARGAIMVDSSTKLKRIYDFIYNPNHFVTSFSGRPWVIAENKLRTGTFNTNLRNLQHKYENYSTQKELKVVRLGTEEYKKSKRLKDLYVEFRNHLNVLVQRLVMEEKDPGPELSDHDIDMGGVKTADRHHYIVLENLERDTCPLLMMDFIHEHTSITAQTYVFPSLLAETYARGAIMVDSITKLKKIYDFINDSNHCITSFSGRPWVIAENNLRTGTFDTNLQSLQPKYEYYSTKDELKLVRLGTEEYRKSKQLKDLYLEFRDHLNWLVQRLGMEEKKNWDPFSFCKLKKCSFNGRFL